MLLLSMHISSLKRCLFINLCSSYKLGCLSFYCCCKRSLYNLDTNPHCWLCSLQICSPEYERISHSVMSDSLQLHELSPARLLCPSHSPGKNTEVGSCSLLQGLFQTQGLNLGLPYCRRILYHVSHQGSPCSPILQLIFSFS